MRDERKSRTLSPHGTLMSSAKNHSQPPTQHRARPSGGCVLVAAIFGLFLAWLSHQYSHVRVGLEAELVDAGYWAMGMTVVLGAAVTSIRRERDEGRVKAYIAAAICLVSIGWVVVELVMMRLRSVD
jgi:hypothetical protein